MEESERIEEDKVRARPFIIPQYSSFKMWWDILISVLASVDSLSVPFFYCFKLQTASFAESQGWQWANRLIDLIYILDIVLAFRTTYIDGGTGDEIRQPKMLARRYLREGFPLDFIAAISVITNLKSLGIPMSE